MGSKFSTEDKLNILGASARYDICCSTGSPNRRQIKKSSGSIFPGLAHVWTTDGKCMPVLKVLQSNMCIHDCAYCENRASNDILRSAFTPNELADLTVDLYRKNLIRGLFLSSAVVRSPDNTMELLIKTAKKLREEYRFRGYIHMKLMPATDPKLVHEACRYASRVSVNIELPTVKSLELLAPQKSKESILNPMKCARNIIDAAEDEKKTLKNAPKLVPAGQTTQMIIGATPESDLQILNLSEYFYEKMNLRRVYYSAFERVNDDPRLPELENPPLLREHRLYQADWLLRFYGFSVGEIVDEKEPFLDSDFDPKLVWAFRNLHLFPIDVNRADYEMLIRVPGIGLKSAKRILKARKLKALDLDDLKKLGAVAKRAQYFLTSNGRFLGDIKPDIEPIKTSLLKESKRYAPQQLSLFPEPTELISTAIGEI